MKQRQGDVLIIAVNAIPEGLEKVPTDNGRTILAYGEVTGHAHAVIGDVEFLRADMDEMSDRFLRVLDEHAEVVHDEHATLTLPAGDYIVRLQREYTPEALRNVAD